MGAEGVDAREGLHSEVSRRGLTELTFVDWYIRWLFGGMADTGDDDGLEVDRSEEDSSGEGKALKGGGSWSSVRWAVAPTASEGFEGVSWKCVRCRVLNEWSVRRCIACDAESDHLGADTSTSAAGGSGSFTFGISGSGFVFGGAVGDKSSGEASVKDKSSLGLTLVDGGDDAPSSQIVGRNEAVSTSATQAPTSLSSSSSLNDTSVVEPGLSSLTALYYVRELNLCGEDDDEEEECAGVQEELDRARGAWSSLGAAEESEGSVLEARLL